MQRQDGVPTFQKLRQRRDDRHVFLSAFDLLELDGQDLRREPIEVRKEKLASISRTAICDLPSDTDGMCEMLIAGEAGANFPQ